MWSASKTSRTSLWGSCGTGCMAAVLRVVVIFDLCFWPITSFLFVARSSICIWLRPPAKIFYWMFCRGITVAATSVWAFLPFPHNKSGSLTPRSSLFSPRGRPLIEFYLPISAQKLLYSVECCWGLINWSRRCRRDVFRMVQVARCRNVLCFFGEFYFQRIILHVTGVIEGRNFSLVNQVERFYLQYFISFRLDLLGAIPY